MKLYFSINLLYLIFQNWCILIDATGCKLNTKELSEFAPLLIRSDSDELITASNIEGSVLFDEGSIIRLACSTSVGQTKNTMTIGKHWKQDWFAICDNGEFNLGIDESIYSIRCLRIPEAEEIKSEKKCQLGTADLYQVGFRFNNGKSFIKLIDICIDTQTYRTYYTKHTLNRFADHIDMPKSLGWSTGKAFENLNNVDNSYALGSQNTIINQQILNGINYITADRLLSKGHLAPAGDFFYPAQKAATYFYSNSAPQWNTTTTTWNWVENHFREYARENNMDLEVTTGTYDIDSFNYGNNKVGLSLFVGGVVPVPRIFWKIFYRRDTYQGIAVIGINNPNITESEPIGKEYLICRPLDRTLIYGNSQDGFYYECNLNDFLDAIQIVTGISHFRNWYQS